MTLGRHSPVQLVSNRLTLALRQQPRERAHTGCSAGAGFRAAPANQRRSAARIPGTSFNEATVTSPTNTRSEMAPMGSDALSAFRWPRGRRSESRPSNPDGKHTDPRDPSNSNSLRRGRIMSAGTANLNWLITRFVLAVPAVRRAVVVSSMALPLLSRRKLTVSRRIGCRLWRRE